MTQELFTEPLPSPLLIKKEMPITDQQAAFITYSRKKVASILEGQSLPILLIAGPCSIHDRDSSLEYAEKLKKLGDKHSDVFYVVMRTYFEKPRTVSGWKGMLYDPNLNGSHDITTGLRQSRQLLLELAEIGLPAATEFLDPATPAYIGDLISWACIGARTVESQIHRQFASGLPMPVSFKNSTGGNIDAAINGIISAKAPHAFFGIDDSGHIAIKRSKGNSHGHITLRGGEAKPNYDPQSIAYALGQLRANHLLQSLIVDCSHDNSCRNFEAQTTVFHSVIGQYLQGNHHIRGLILESHLEGGSQQINSDFKALRYAVSLTDACLDWSSTEKIVEEAAQKLRDH